MRERSPSPTWIRLTLSPWGRSSPKHLSAWNNSNFLRFVSIKIWVLNFWCLQFYLPDGSQRRTFARESTQTSHYPSCIRLLTLFSIWAYLERPPDMILPLTKRYDGRCFCILQIGSFREESESISAQMTHVDNLMSRLITSIAGKYQPSVSWQPFKRLSKELLQSTQHNDWKASLLAKR